MDSTAKPPDLAKLAARGWISLNGFAKLIGVTYPTALAMMRREQIKPIRVGGIWRIYSAEVQRFLEQGNSPKSADDPSDADVIDHYNNN